MKFNLKKLSDTKIEVSFSLSKPKVAEAEAEAVKELASTVKVKGFRAGKAPIAAIKKEINPNALADKTIEIAINQSFLTMIDAEKIIPLDRPEISIDKFIPGELIEFKATFEVMPAIKLPNYKNLKAKLETVKVSAEEVSQALDRLAQSYAEESVVDRPAKIGDRVLIDFEGFKDGQPFAGGKAENYDLELGSNQFIPGFEQGIVGKKPKDSFSLDLQFPSDYHSSDLKGAKVEFKVHIRTIKQVSKPELDDEFAKKTKMFDNLADLKADIKNNILLQKQEQAKEDFKNKLIDELASQIKVELPDVLLNDQINAIERDMKQNLSYYGQDLNQYLESTNKDYQTWLNEDVKPVAITRVKAGLALAELSKELKISVSESEIDDKIDEIRTQNGNNKEVLSHLDHDHTRHDVKSNLITIKTIDKLVELNS